MQYVHVKNIDKFNPGYRDRKHIWAKVYWGIFIDEDYQTLCEVDRHRLIGLIVFEVYNQRPVALTNVNCSLLGWDIKKRSIQLTLQMLHTFIEVRNESVTQSRVDKSRVDNIYTGVTPLQTAFDFNTLWAMYPRREGRKEAERHFRNSVKTEKDYQDCQQAVGTYKAHIASANIKRQYIKMGSTFFNNWREWITNPIAPEVFSMQPLKSLKE